MREEFQPFTTPPLVVPLAVTLPCAATRTASYFYRKLLQCNYSIDFGLRARRAYLALLDHFDR